jgi:orotidine-5'-phosphate decarboxylase
MLQDCEISGSRIDSSSGNVEIQKDLAKRLGLMGENGSAAMPDGSWGVTNIPRDLPSSMADRLIVALDLPSVDEARKVTEQLGDIVSFYKIGLWLLFAPGTDQFIDDLLSRGKRIFLDYKMFDIGETVRRGVETAKSRGISFVTVHGDPEIMSAAVAGKGSSQAIKIFAISVLTSLDDQALKRMGYGISVKELIALRVRESIKCGCDGIIASADDRPDEIRRLVDNDRLLIATPGIRMAGDTADDHKRLSTPEAAIAAGADYLVVGRPIVRSLSPSTAALEIIAGMERGGGLRSLNK